MIALEEQPNIPKKKARKQNAKPLPPSITHDMMKKYVVFYEEWVYPAKKTKRFYFKIEGHPLLIESWVGIKSSQMTIQDKLAQANKRVEDLDVKWKELQQEHEDASNLVET